VKTPNNRPEYQLMLDLHQLAKAVERIEDRKVRYLLTILANGLADALDALKPR
jgi:hypothetical protein